MEELLEQFSLGLFFWQTIIFLILLLVLKKFAWKPILDVINKREQMIKSSLEEARLARKEMEQLTDKKNKMIKETKIKRDYILKDARELKKKILLESRLQARNEADKIIESAKISIYNEKMAVVIQLKNHLASISIGIAEKILNKELSDKNKQIELIENLINVNNTN